MLEEFIDDDYELSTTKYAPGPLYSDRTIPVIILDDQNCKYSKALKKLIENFPYLGAYKASKKIDVSEENDFCIVTFTFFKKEYWFPVYILKTKLKKDQFDVLHLLLNKDLKGIYDFYEEL
jgi:hypothetical protein